MNRSDKDRKESKTKDEEMEEVEEPSLKEYDFNLLPSSDEEDIDEPCRQIFTDYTPETPETPTTAQSKPPPFDDTDNKPKVVDKKRQAYENAGSVSRQLPTLKPNHSQSALFTAQRRQELAFDNAIAIVKEKDEQIAKLEAEIREKEKAALTPLVNPLTFQRLYRKVIAPITPKWLLRLLSERSSRSIK